MLRRQKQNLVLFSELSIELKKYKPSSIEINHKVSLQHHLMSQDYLRRPSGYLLEGDVIVGPRGVPRLRPGTVEVLPVLRDAVEVRHIEGRV